MNLTLPNKTAQQWAITACLICGLLLTGALFFEFVMGLAPCPLCMMQRLWFALAAIITYLGLLHNPRWGIYAMLTIVAAAIGAYFSVRHLWLQSLPEDQVPACGPPLQYMLEAFSLSDVLIEMTRGTGDCAKAAWSLLGITLPGWALLGFVAVIGCGVMQLRAGLAR
jgi:disulfide bond formation protein DsbB